MENKNEYYILSDNSLLSKKKVDEAFEIVNSFRGGAMKTYLSDSEVFANGDCDFVGAVKLFKDKYDTGLIDAVEAIRWLRGTN